MRIYQIILIFISLGWFQNAHAQAQLGNTIFGMEDDGCGTSITLSEDGSIVAIGYGDEGDGVVRVFEWDQSNWVQLGNDITAPNNKGYDFGRTLSLTGDGHTILIGDPVNNSGATYGGQLTVFTLQNNTWTLVGQPINGLAPDDRFGQSLAISKDGSRIIAGAPYNDIAGAASGMTRVFRLVNNIWTIQGTTINGQGANNWSGWAVDLSWSGDTIIIGEIHNADKGDNSGQVRIFTWSGTDWVKIAQDLNGQDVNDFFGSSVSISANGKILSVGASARNSTAGLLDVGTVYNYRLQGSTWTPQGVPLVGTIENEEFGSSVSLSANGNRLVVSAIEAYSPIDGPGYFSIYNWNNVKWVKKGDSFIGDYNGGKFGIGLAISGDGNRITAGSIENTTLGYVGRVKIFEYEPISHLEQVEKEAITFYPIPSPGQIHCTSGNVEKVHISNIPGHNFGEYSVVNGVLDMTNLPSGSYTLTYWVGKEMLASFVVKY